MTTLLKILAGAMVAVALLAAPALADQTITSSGPLTSITIGADLSCQVLHAADTTGEFFPPGSSPGGCGTFLSINGALFAPATVTGATSATGYTPVSQSPVTGSGTSGDPFKVVTQVTAGNSGVSVTQTDTYVVGQESYRTDVTVVSQGGSGPFVLYSAADCYLQGSDVGFGAVGLAGSTVGCVGIAADGTSPGSRIEGWNALTPGANYYEAGFAEVWRAIASQQPFPNTCRCDEKIDNGAGVSWNGVLGQGAQATYSHTKLISPTAAAPTGPPPPPDAGRSFVAEVVSGNVFIKLPPGHAAARRALAARAGVAQTAGFIPLKGATNVPIGSTVDTRQGTLGLTSAADLKGRTQRAQFHAGVFEVRQQRTSKPTTELRLASASFQSYANACGAKVSRNASAAKSKKRVGRLFGSGKGRFKTRGRFSAATVRGTIWLTEDRCNGTLTSVTKGKVAVFDFGRDKRVTVRAGQSYLARATRAAIRKLGTR